MTNNKLTDIQGIGAAAADLLQKAGFKTADDIAKASPEALSAVKGFGPARAARVIEAAQSLAGSLPEPQTAVGDKPEAGAPAEPQAPSTSKTLDDAKEKLATAVSSPAPEAKAADPAKPAAPAKPTASVKPVATAQPAVSGKPGASEKPAVRPSPPRQPSVARGAAVKRLIREPWYLVGLGIAAMVAAGYAQESGLLDTLSMTEGSATTSVAQPTTAVQERTETKARDSAAEGRAADIQAPETTEETAAAQVPETEPTVQAMPETAVPAVYRPFAYRYGPASEWAQDRADGSLSMNFAGRHGVYGYPQPYPFITHRLRSPCRTRFRAPIRRFRVSGPIKPVRRWPVPNRRKAAPSVTSHTDRKKKRAERWNSAYMDRVKAPPAQGQGPSP